MLGKHFTLTCIDVTRSTWKFVKLSRKVCFANYCIKFMRVLLVGYERHGDFSFDLIPAPQSKIYFATLHFDVALHH